GLGHRRGERLLAQHVDALAGRQPRQCLVRLGTCRDVDAVKLFVGQHRLDVVVHLLDAELRGALLGAGTVHVADSHKLSVRRGLPGWDVLRGDVAAADQRGSKWWPRSHKLSLVAPASMRDAWEG